MTTLIALISLNGALIALAVLAVALIANHQRPSGFVYGASLALTIAGFVLASAFLVSRAAPETVALPIGLPWLGANFRLDALSSFFIAVIDLGAAAASFYALGYGRHEQAPERVLPFYPAFLAGMGLVPLADDAFAFLFVWEFMSLASWALVMAHHREPGERSRRLRLSADGELRHCRAAARLRPARRRRRRYQSSPPCGCVAEPRRRDRSVPSSRWSAPDRRRAWRRCTSGCRSPIPPRRAMSRR